MIEVVQDYVKIVRSHAILSFNFLKNLRLIGGQRLYDIKYVLITSILVFDGLSCAIALVNMIVSEIPVARVCCEFIVATLSGRV
jgi:hypothetical protein